MIIKSVLKNMKKVRISIWSNEQKFPNGKYSTTFSVYDTTPAEVLALVQKALAEATEQK